MVPIPLTFRLPRPSTESSYGRKLTKSWRQKLNAADAPVSRTRSLESVSNDTSSSKAPL